MKRFKENKEKTGGDKTPPVKPLTWSVVLAALAAGRLDELQAVTFGEHVGGLDLTAVDQGAEVGSDVQSLAQERLGFGDGLADEREVTARGAAVGADGAVGIDGSVKVTDASGSGGSGGNCDGALAAVQDDLLKRRLGRTDEVVEAKAVGNALEFGDGKGIEFDLGHANGGGVVIEVHILLLCYVLVWV